MVTFTPHPNFGTCLQSYALNYILKKLGHNVEFIYNNNDFPKRGIIGTVKDFIRYFIPKSLVEKYWKRKRQKKVQSLAKELQTTPEDIQNRIHYPPIILNLPNSKWQYHISRFPYYTHFLKLFKYRTKQWKKVFAFTFEDSNYNMRRIYTTKQYEKVVEEADLFITGSDQIWNPYCCGFNPMMFLEFVNGRKKCIAYSSSISRPSFPPEVKDRIKDDLQKFQHIAVREQSSVELLNKLLNRSDIQLVVDPTWLLSEKEWKDFGNRANIEFDIPEHYIFCYFIGNRYKDYIDMVENIKEKTNINNIITIDCSNSTIKYGNGILYKDGGPYEFIFLLSHADFVCTDSFHATVFSIKFKKEFAHIFKTNEDYDSEISQNARIKDLLNRYHLQEKIYNKDSDKWLSTINWEYTEIIMNKEIEESMQYLKNSI